MILLQASHVAKQYDGHEILTDASVVVQTGDRVALVGANGAGKSTLLRLIVGEELADSGEVSLGKGVSLGYVAQMLDTEENTTVYELIAGTFSEIYQMEKRMRSLEELMATPEVYEDERRFQDVSATYDRLRKSFEDAGGYGVEARIRRVLDGLNFPKEMHNRLVHTLSGGQKTRLSLAKLLAWQPDVLVLDEPTNYLDTDTLTWLEDYLQGYAGSVLVVSHDRYFLDRVATVIYELDEGKTTRYVGNYSVYVDEKAARLEGDTKRYEAQQAEIARMESFIQKNISRATTTKRAQSRRKLLDRMPRLEKPSASTPKMALRFQVERQSGKDVLRVERLVVGYGERTLPGPLDVYVSRGQRIAIIGPNGIGKTTFLKALVGRKAPVSGSIQWGHHVDLGYYDQEQTDLDNSKTVLSQIWDAYPSLDKTTVRTALGRFLFRGEDVDKPVQTLSGGERSRLSLCHLMLQQSNVLVFDEPTNHLDLLSKEVLEDALDEYEGTLIFVSHDRYFIDALATHVLSLDESGFTLYIGNYTEYYAKRQDQLKWSDEEEKPGIGKATGSSSKTAGDAVASADLRDEGAGTGAPSRSTHVRSADVRKMREKVTTVEKRIADVEARQEAIGQEMVECTNQNNFQKIAALQQELGALTEEHEQLLETWEALATELETLESKMG